jgi:hypothetical protein
VSLPIYLTREEWSAAAGELVDTYRHRIAAEMANRFGTEAAKHGATALLLLKMMANPKDGRMFRSRNMNEMG